MDWREFAIILKSKYSSPRALVFAAVATHSHFVLDRGGYVFKQSAPVIKLPDDATEEEYIQLLGLLNSSVACFWMKQAFHNKGSTVDQHGLTARMPPFEDFYDHTGTGLKAFPVCEPRPT